VLKLADQAVISIVDDDDSVRVATSKLLKLYGFIVHAFGSAEEFLRSKYLDETRCLIADVRMPGMSGIELQERLKQQGYTTDTSGGGDVSIVPEDNAVTLTAFQQGQIDGAWVPEPWATRLVKEGGGKILVDEASLWPKGRFVTTDLIVSQKFLSEHPDVVKQLIEGEVAAIDLTKTNRKQAESYVASGIQAATGKAIAPDLVTASFDSITFTTDPIVSSLLKNAQESKALGFTTSDDVKGIYDLSILNQVLKAKSQPTISTPANA